MKVVVFNDTLQQKINKRHFGCQLVRTAFDYQFDRVGIECLGYMHWKEDEGNFKGYKNRLRVLDQADLVIVNGEGTFSGNRCNELAKISYKYPSVLINTVFYKNNVDLSKFKYVSVREKMSKQEVLKTSRKQCDVIADIILTSPELKEVQNSNNKQTYKLLFEDKNEIWSEPKVILYRIKNCSKLITNSFHGILCGHYFNKDIKVAPRKWTVGNYNHKLESIVKDLHKEYVEEHTKKINALFENTLYEII